MGKLLQCDLCLYAKPSNATVQKPIIIHVRSHFAFLYYYCVQSIL
jgi:hypothetical protein